MVSYRRARVPGGTYFFTAALRDRRATLLIDQVDALITVMRDVRAIRPFRIDACVVLPDHLHAIWTLPDHDSDFPGRWKALKSHFTRVVKSRGIQIPANARNEHALWQRRYWEHLIVSDDDYMRHVDYIHSNPVKHGLVTRARDWRWSTFHRYVRDGMLDVDWMSTPTVVKSLGAVS